MRHDTAQAIYTVQLPRNRTCTRTVARFVSLYTPFLPGHTGYEVVQVLKHYSWLATIHWRENTTATTTATPTNKYGC